jgi:class I fructose-bisphosphate aldolase
MVQIDANILERDGKVMLLAYDQGFEHGPTDFDEKSVDPNYILDIARYGLFTGVIFQEGVAAKYYPSASSGQAGLPPLIVKLNGKTSFQGEEPLSLQLCTVEKAIELGAKAVGYTIYVGSEREEQMLAEFSRIEDEAHAKGLVVIAWMYPRGKKVEGKQTTKETLAYAARLGMELNADYVKIAYSGDIESFKWVVAAAGKTKVLAQGGKKMTWPELEAEVKGALAAGAAGIAVGRNVWQDPNPKEIAKKLAELVYL